MPPGVAEAVQLRLADAGVVVDRDLAHAQVAPERLEHHLRRELHPRRMEVERLERAPPGGAHAAMGVGDLHTEEEVEKPGEDRVPDVAVEPRHRLAVDRALKPRADHQVVAVSEPLDEGRELAERICAIRVRHHDVLALRVGQAGEVGAAVAGPLLADDSRAVVRRDPGRVVGRSIVHDDHLARAARRPDARPGIVHDRPDGIRLVQARDHDRDLGRHWAIIGVGRRRGILASVDRWLRRRALYRSASVSTGTASA